MKRRRLGIFAAGMGRTMHAYRAPIHVVERVEHATRVRRALARRRPSR